MEKEDKESGVRSSYNQARLLYDYSMIKDPGIGRIPSNIYNKEMEEARTIRTKGSSTGSGAQGMEDLNNYIAAGPDSIGGRTRAVVFDKRYNGTSNRVILSGSVSGGIFRSAVGGSNWTR